MPSVSTARTRRTRCCLQAPDLAAGAVVTREHPLRGTEVVIIHGSATTTGRCQRESSMLASRYRRVRCGEVQEETGVTIRLSVPLDSITYQAGNAGLKKVDYWGGVVLTRCAGGRTRKWTSSWLPVRAALGRLTYSHDHFLVQQYLEQPSTTPLIILRHAKAMDRKDWSRKDSARPIISRGRRQAKMLIPMLERTGDQLVSSTSTRCTATVPYAHERELAVETYSLLSEEERMTPRASATWHGRFGPRHSRVSQLQSACTDQCCRTFSRRSILADDLGDREFLVAHLTAEGTVHALERHRLSLTAVWSVLPRLRPPSHLNNARPRPSPGPGAGWAPART